MSPFTSPWAFARSLPAPSRRALLGRLLALVVGNGIVGVLVSVGQVQPLALVIFVGVETALLGLIETVQLRSVRPEDRPTGDRRTLLQRLAVPFFLTVIVAANLAVIASLLDSWPVLLDMLRRPWSAFAGTALVWPLAVTLGKALLDVRADARRHAERGGEFVSTPGLNAQAHALTLVFGALPHALPILAWVAVASRTLERRSLRLGPTTTVAEAVSRRVLAALGLYGVVTLLFLAWVVSSGAAGWSVAFFGAKVVSEALVLCFPAARGEQGSRSPEPAHRTAPQARAPRRRTRAPRRPGVAGPAAQE